MDCRICGFKNGAHITHFCNLSANQPTQPPMPIMSREKLIDLTIRMLAGDIGMSNTPGSTIGDILGSHITLHDKVERLEKKIKEIQDKYTESLKYSVVDQRAPYEQILTDLKALFELEDVDGKKR